MSAAMSRFVAIVAEWSAVTKASSRSSKARATASSPRSPSPPTPWRARSSSSASGATSHGHSAFAWRCTPARCRRATRQRTRADDHPLCATASPSRTVARRCSRRRPTTSSSTPSRKARGSTTWESTGLQGHRAPRARPPASPPGPARQRPRSRRRPRCSRIFPVQLDVVHRPGARDRRGARAACRSNRIVTSSALADAAKTRPVGGGGLAGRPPPMA